MKWSTTDPRSAGLALPQGSVVHYVADGECTTLLKYGPAATDWATYSGPMRRNRAVTVDPRTAGLAGAVDDRVLYVSDAAAVALVKYGAGATDWVACPSQTSGSAGTAGPRGPQGEQGPQGAAGAQGLQGIQGPQGPTGSAGAQGPKGDTGAQGPKGDTGSQGIQGVPGTPGTNGSQGPAGPAPSGTGFVKVSSGVLQAPSSTIAISEVTGLQSAIDGKQAAGSYAAASHAHAQSDVTGLAASLGAKADAAHGHAIGDTTGLQAALDGKQPSGSYAASSHTHTAGQVTGLATIATSGSAADLGAGVIPVARLPVVTETANGAMPANMGRKASLATNKSIANTLTQVVGYTAAANTLKAGTVIRFQAIGLQTNTTVASSSVITLRINAASLGAIIEASWTCAMGTVARTNATFYVDGEIVILSAGTGGAGAGQAFGAIMVTSGALAYAAPTTTVAAAVNANTTQSNVVEMACISGAASTTWNFISATIEIVQP